MVLLFWVLRDSDLSLGAVEVVHLVISICTIMILGTQPLKFPILVGIILLSHIHILPALLLLG